MIYSILYVYRIQITSITWPKVRHPNISGLDVQTAEYQVSCYSSERELLLALARLVVYSTAVGKCLRVNVE